MTAKNIKSEKTGHVSEKAKNFNYLVHFMLSINFFSFCFSELFQDRDKKIPDASVLKDLLENSELIRVDMTSKKMRCKIWSSRRIEKGERAALVSLGMEGQCVEILGRLVRGVCCLPGGININGVTRVIKATVMVFW
jgi:hypothetical protein